MEAVRKSSTVEKIGAEQSSSTKNRIFNSICVSFFDNPHNNLVRSPLRRRLQPWTGLNYCPNSALFDDGALQGFHSSAVGILFFCLNLLTWNYTKSWARLDVWLWITCGVPEGGTPLAVVLCTHFAEYWNHALVSEGSTVSIKGRVRMCFPCRCGLVRGRKWGEGRVEVTLTEVTLWLHKWIVSNLLVQFIIQSALQYLKSPSPFPPSCLK